VHASTQSNGHPAAMPNSRQMIFSMAVAIICSLFRLFAQLCKCMESFMQRMKL
jgi:hypothetical protein